MIAQMQSKINAIKQSNAYVFLMGIMWADIELGESQKKSLTEQNEPESNRQRIDSDSSFVRKEKRGKSLTI